jgi:hypothetical protein
VTVEIRFEFEKLDEVGMIDEVATSVCPHTDSVNENAQRGQTLKGVGNSEYEE